MKEIFLWFIAIFLISFDVAFYDVFVIFPLFLFLDSVNEFTWKKAIRYIILLTLYGAVIYKQISIFWVIVSFLIIMIDANRDAFFKLWVPAFLEAVLLVLPMIIQGSYIQPILSLAIAVLIYFYLWKKRLIKYGGV
ncbi:hypothetical protein JYK00_05515 [Thermosipho ferrireducens]|uniref:Uncharacterized protein n=1 Tax=Thermosipho ferrireducens TaxID=2571116 RepID=A0ABX7S464_9BACT|nr:hypothetical protein [Thermosipho ferrireducens]QTA37209.1 hypothetical protein JYK00_05515 [Thermosipho ferrireducens]